jgi:hypothetical protein
MEFVASVGFGLIAGGAALILRRSTPLPIGGLLFAAAGAAGLGRFVGLPRGLIFGLIALAGAGLVVELLRLPRLAAFALAVPGAWLLAYQAELVEVGWIRALVGIAIAAGLILMSDFERVSRKQNLGLPLLAITAAGIYLTVPDTEQAVAIMGAAMLVAALGLIRPVVSLGVAGSYVATGLLAWTIAAGGFGRPASILGGLACFGLFWVEPLTRFISRRATLLVSIPVAVTAHSILVLIASRVVGRGTRVPQALLLSAAELVIAAAIGVGVSIVLAPARDRKSLGGFKHGRWMIRPAYRSDRSSRLEAGAPR